MSELKFEIVEREEIEVTVYTKTSKYDPIIDAFIKKDISLGEITIEGMTPDYLRTQLQKRLKKRELNDKYVAKGNKTKVYLERVSA